MQKGAMESARRVRKPQQQVSNQENNSVDYCVNLLDKMKRLFFISINS